MGLPARCAQDERSSASGAWYGWSFAGPGASGPYYGAVREQKNPRPTQNMVVNFGDPAYPMVYVVSRTVP
ncbi:hypothetical protein SGLAM104S_08562 [Streptomyces glaucescens]